MARRSVGLTIRSTSIGQGDGGLFSAIGHRVDGGTAAAAIAVDSTALTTDASDIATDNTNLTTNATNIASSSTAITATAALIATDNTTLGTTDNTAVEAAVATLEGDGASPTQAHVTALRGVWDTMKTHLTTFGTHSGTATSDASTLATRSTSLGTNRTSLGTHSGTLTTDAATLATDSASAVAGSADIVLSYDASVVVSKNVLRRALQHLLAQVEASNDLT